MDHCPGGSGATHCHTMSFESAPTEQKYASPAQSALTSLWWPTEKRLESVARSRKPSSGCRSSTVPSARPTRTTALLLGSCVVQSASTWPPHFCAKSQPPWPFQTRTCWSNEPVRKKFWSPMASAQTAVTTSVWPELFFVSKPWHSFRCGSSTLQTLTDLSIDPDSRNVPPDENNAREVTPSTWPSSLHFNRNLLFAASKPQQWIAPSCDPV
mmetsp:Transcript_6430/g.19906  ORF Transcript_6430/g.19906 Transcript_6430/m.19906 type:complete len:212 (-) Transcript_6430:862-1497(-)